MSKKADPNEANADPQADHDSRGRLMPRRMQANVDEESEQENTQSAQSPAFKE